VRRSPFRRWRPAARALRAPAAVLLVIGCASAPKPRQLGDYSSLTPRLAVVDSQRPPRSLSVDLSAPASVVVVYVAPGRSTRIVYPADSVAPPPLSAGSHRVIATWPRPRTSADSARRDSIARATRARAGRDSAARATTARSVMALPDPEAGLAPTGYLLLFATPRPLQYGEVRRKVEGVTTPLDVDEALNAIAKQVRSTLDPAAPWAAYAVEVTVASDEQRRPPQRSRAPRSAAATASFDLAVCRPGSDVPWPMRCCPEQCDRPPG
jgi:hypothetical protein